MIGLIDYGAGNLASVRNAFARIGHEATAVGDPASLDNFDRAILPGVGSFRAAMAVLDARGWRSPIAEYVASGRPFLGICLGMQLLLDRGQEHGDTVGLGLIPGEVVQLRPVGALKVPHVGWNALLKKRAHPLFAGVRDHVDFYFVHSFHCRTADDGAVIATCDYGGEFVASLGRANIAGMQFHPEKSQPGGLRILDNFARWDGRC